MNNSEFSHLHYHSHYSLLDGIGTPKQICEHAKELGFQYVAVTDHGNIDGAIKLQSEATKCCLKAVIGTELYLTQDCRLKSKEVKSAHVTVWVKNSIGYKNLLRLLTIGNLEGFYYRPRIGFRELLDHCEGLVIATACCNSFINLEGGENLLRQLAHRLPGDVYAEIMPHNTKEQKEINDKVVNFQISKNEYLPVIATNDVHYLLPEHSVTQEILLAIQKKTTWNNPNRWKFDPRYIIHMRTADEMIEAFEKQNQFERGFYLSAMRETINIAKKCCDFKIPKQTFDLPRVPGIPEDEEKYFKELINKGLKKRFGTLYPKGGYSARIEEELGVISKLGFVRYFLIIHDLIQWCKENDIMVGPGRGSAGGSLIAYLIEITNVDSIKFHLPFSRFLNENRVSNPDIDIDFEDRYRDRVIQRLRDIYGEYNVANISTFMSMKEKSAFRDVCRVMEVPQEDVDEVAKTIDNLEEFGDSKIGTKFNRKYPNIVEHASNLTGQVRNSGKHASGIIVSANDLRYSDRCYLALREGALVVNWDGNDCDHQGLMKLDVLGLSTLSVLSETKRLIEANNKTMWYHPESESIFIDKRDATIADAFCETIDFDFEKIPLEDRIIFSELSKGNTCGVFQFGTRPMTKLTKEMGIEKFTHMSDAVALVRPGPKDSGMTDSYVKRKHGETWEQKHELYEEVLKETYGVVVFQEHIMNIINKVAGLPFTIADEIRKIIGKKRDVKEFEQFKDMFIQGCLKMKTLSEEEAEEAWEGFEKGANYLFNKSHAVLYAMISYWCAYLKHYVPSEYICACLTYDDKTNKNDLLKEAVRIGLKVMPPKISISDARLWKVVDNKLFAPFSEIKGIGEKAAIEIANAKPLKTKGFMSRVKSEPIISITGKNGDLIKQLGCLDPEKEEIPNECAQYFDFDIGIDYKHKYPKLYKMVGEEIFRKFPIDDLLTGNINGLSLCKEVKKFKLKGLSKCNDCELRKECGGPVHPSYNRENNVVLVAEAPGETENEEGEGLVGKAGKRLWSEFKKLDIERDMFHISNIVKCFPKETRTPKENHIEKCRKWLNLELKEVKPFLVLAFGNVPLKFFKNQDGGIKNLCGTTEWLEDYGLWICWCVHPSYVLRNPGEIELFREGLLNFSNALKNIGGI